MNLRFPSRLVLPVIFAFLSVSHHATTLALKDNLGKSIDWFSDRKCFGGDLVKSTKFGYYDDVEFAEKMKNSKIRTLWETANELGGRTVDVLISRCELDGETDDPKRNPFFRMNDAKTFRCASNVRFYVYEKCASKYTVPKNAKDCVTVVDDSDSHTYSGIPGTLFTHVLKKWDNGLADFTIVLKDGRKHLHGGDAILNLEMHLSTITNCTGFMNVGDVPAKVQGKIPRKNRDIRAIGTYVSKRIPSKVNAQGLDNVAKFARKFNLHYCEKFERYTCKKCEGALVSLRQQSLISKSRIKRLSKSEYYLLQSLTRTKDNTVREDGFGFEKLYSILFACYQKLTPSLIGKLKKNRFPHIVCDDNELNECVDVNNSKF